MRPDDRPGYDRSGATMQESRGPIARKLARQALVTCSPFFSRPQAELVVLDIGCGYGHMALAFAEQCRSVVGIEPSRTLAGHAQELAAQSGHRNLQVRQHGVEELSEESVYDFVVLDNVFEHVPDQPRCLENIARALRPGGVLYAVVPNKLWPIEHHYALPFLGYLPLSLANRYLRASGRGEDYTDASYAPTYFRIRRLFRNHPELELRFVPPASVEWTMDGGALHYRLGVAALKRIPALWLIAKCFLIVAVKTPDPLA